MAQPCKVALCSPGSVTTQSPCMHGVCVCCVCNCVSQDDDGWFSVSITPAAATAAKATGPRPHRLRQDTVVVLTKAKPQHAQHGPQHSAQHAQHGSNADSGVWVVAGIVRQGNMQNPMQAVTVAMHPACPAHMGCGGDAPCMQVRSASFAMHTYTHTPMHPQKSSMHNWPTSTRSSLASLLVCICAFFVYMCVCMCLCLCVCVHRL